MSDARIDTLMEAAIESLLDDAWEREGREADPDEFSWYVVRARAEAMANEVECFDEVP